jgi:hypothetical protein
LYDFCGPEVPGSLKYTAHDVLEIGPTPSSDDGQGYTSNKNGTIATKRAYWKQEWYIGNNEGILAIMINWQQELYTANKESILATRIVH